jgi:high-affinity Fe2+/Pb2+ permease
LLESREGIPEILWVGLIFGALLTVGFAYGFGVESGQSHALMLGTLAASVALLLFIVSTLNFAFHGDVRVTPEPFQLVLEQFRVE